MCKKIDIAGIRTQFNNSDGSYADHYTTNALRSNMKTILN